MYQVVKNKQILKNDIWTQAGHSAIWT